MSVVPIDRRLYFPIAVRTPTAGDGRRTVGATDIFLQCWGIVRGIQVAHSHALGSRANASLECCAQYQKRNTRGVKVLSAAFLYKNYKSESKNIHHSISALSFRFYINTLTQGCVIRADHHDTAQLSPKGSQQRKKKTKVSGAALVFVPFLFATTPRAVPSGASERDKTSIFLDRRVAFSF